MVCSRTILGSIVFKEGNTPNPKKIEAFVKMPIPKTPQEIQVFNGMAQFYRHFIKKIYLYYGTNYQVIQKNKNVRVNY